MAAAASDRFRAPAPIRLNDSAIVETVNALRWSNDYLFTTGGIGPTQDHINIDAIAARLGIRASTARSYLKDTLQKTGATRQAELAALLARI